MAIFSPVSLIEMLYRIPYSLLLFSQIKRSSVAGVRLPAVTPHPRQLDTREILVPPPAAAQFVLISVSIDC